MSIQSKLLLSRMERLIDSFLSIPNNMHLGAKFGEILKLYPKCRTIGVSPTGNKTAYALFRNFFGGKIDAYMCCDESFGSCILAFNAPNGSDNSRYVVRRLISDPSNNRSFFDQLNEDGTNDVNIIEDSGCIRIETLRSDDGTHGFILVVK